jgi:dTDP-glucose pyrophosphorylase
MIRISKIKKNILKENSKLQDVLKILNTKEHKICIVCDNKNIPLGIFTDEDIRRKLIKKNSRNFPVNKNYNKNFIFCYNNDEDQKIKKIFKDYYWISTLLVLNKKNKKLVGIIDKDSFLNSKKIKNHVLILAGGLGQRLRPLTEYLPKPMLSFSGKPLLESTIYSLKSSGFYNINISVNYLSEKILDYFGDGSNYNININYFKESKKLGTAGPLFYLKKLKLKDPILIVNGDIYTNLNFKDLLNYHKINKNDFTVCCHDYYTNIPYGVIDKKNKNFINEKPKIRYTVNSGIYVIDPIILNTLKQKTFLNMNDLINKSHTGKKKIGIYKINGSILDIGTFSSYEAAKELIKNV